MLPVAVSGICVGLPYSGAATSMQAKSHSKDLLRTFGVDLDDLLIEGSADECLAARALGVGREEAPRSTPKYAETSEESAFNTLARKDRDPKGGQDKG